MSTSEMQPAPLELPLPLKIELHGAEWWRGRVTVEGRLLPVTSLTVDLAPDRNAGLLTVTMTLVLDPQDACTLEGVLVPTDEYARFAAWQLQQLKRLRAAENGSAR